MGSERSGKTLTQRGASTQQRLVDAAWEVFSSRPYGDAHVTDITRQAGVSTGSFYTYFSSKEELFRIIAREVLEEIAAAPVRDPDNPENDPVRDIAYASRQFFEACLRHQMVARSIELLHSHDEGTHLARNEALVRGAKRAERWVRRLQDAGICDRDLDPWYTAVALQSMNTTLAYEQLVHRDDPVKLETLVEAVTPIWARAVGLNP